MGGAGAVAGGGRLPLPLPGGDRAGRRSAPLAALPRLQRTPVLRRHGAGRPRCCDPALAPVRRDLQPGVRRLVRTGEPGALAAWTGYPGVGAVLPAGRLARAARRASRRRRGRVAVHVRLARGPLPADGAVDLRDGPGACSSARIGSATVAVTCSTSPAPPRTSSRKAWRTAACGPSSTAARCTRSIQDTRCPACSTASCSACSGSGTWPPRPPSAASSSCSPTASSDWSARSMSGTTAACGAGTARTDICVRPSTTGSTPRCCGR